MSHLGSFGAAVKEADPQAEKDTFEFCGETFTVHGRIAPMLMLQLGAAATEKIDQQEGFGAIWEAMRCSLTKPERVEAVDGEQRTVPADRGDFQRFYKLAVANCVDLEDLIRVAMALFEAQAGRPTEEPQGSSAGQSATSPSSNGSSSAPSGRLVSVDQLMAG